MEAQSQAKMWIGGKESKYTKLVREVREERD